MPSRLEIDLGAMERNLGLVRGVVGGMGGTGQDGRQTRICSVLKQDAYGMGAVRIARRMAATGAVEMIAVYTLDEARAIAESVPVFPILVLMPTPGVDRMDPLYRHLAAGRVHLTLHSLDQFAAVQDMASRVGAQVPVHVQVDTGLSRGGAMAEDAAKLIQRVVMSPRMRLAGLMTHFASPCSDDALTREQAKRFREFVEGVRPSIKAAVESGERAVARLSEMVVHAANTCAMFRSRAYHGTLVRVGQALLGYAGADVPAREAARFEFQDEMDSLEPAIRWVSSVAHAHEIPAGWPVGYGSTWCAPARADGRRTRIALIPVGYADGLARSLGGDGDGGPGWVGLTGRPYAVRESIAPDASERETVYAPIVGRVSMDQITVDVTDVPEWYLGRPGAGAGSEVELYSRLPGAPNYLPKLADAAGTITHDLLCRVSPRVERVYQVSSVQRPEAETQPAPSIVVRPSMLARPVAAA